MQCGAVKGGNNAQPGPRNMEREETNRMPQFDRITWDPAQMNGQPCIRGMRLTVRRVLQLIAQYPDRKELFVDYPELEEEDLRQALAYAAANLEDEARSEER